MALIPSMIQGTIHPHVLGPVTMLILVAVCGIAASLLATRRAMRLRMIDSLRADS